MLVNQTLEQMIQSWLERKLRLLVFGRPVKGEPAYDYEPKFKSTYPAERQRDTPEAFNNWMLRDVHKLDRKKVRTKK